MSLESGTYINSLVKTNPTGQDLKATWPAHMRLIKTTLVNTFPNLSTTVHASATELNMLRYGGSVSGNLAVKGYVICNGGVFRAPQLRDLSGTTGGEVIYDITDEVMQIYSARFFHAGHYSKLYHSVTATPIYTLNPGTTTATVTLNCAVDFKGKDWTGDGQKTFIPPQSRSYRVAYRYLVSASSSTAVKLTTRLHKGETIVNSQKVYWDKLFGNRTEHGAFYLKLSSTSTCKVSVVVAKESNGSVKILKSETGASIEVRKL